MKEIILVIIITTWLVGCGVKSESQEISITKVYVDDPEEIMIGLLIGGAKKVEANQDTDGGFIIKITNPLDGKENWKAIRSIY